MTTPDFAALLRLPVPSWRTGPALPATLEAASKIVQAGRMPDHNRPAFCLLSAAAHRIADLERLLTKNREALVRVRRQRNEARDGQIKPDWWNDVGGDDASYTAPSDALDHAGPFVIVGVQGAAQVGGPEYGFRVPSDDDGKDRDLWFATKAEAEAEAELVRITTDPGEQP